MGSPIEELEKMLSKVRQDGKLVVVEGMKDKKALNGLGIMNVMTLKGPLYKAAEEIASISKDVVLLTDLDREGKKLFGALNSSLQDLGVRVDKRLREFLFRNTRLRQIEGLAGYMRRSKG